MCMTGGACGLLGPRRRPRRHATDEAYPSPVDLIDSGSLQHSRRIGGRYLIPSAGLSPLPQAHLYVSDPHYRLFWPKKLRALGEYLDRRELKGERP